MMKDDNLFDEYFGRREIRYPFKWWQLWHWNPYWQCRAYRYRWVRDLFNRNKKIR